VGKFHFLTTWALALAYFFLPFLLDFLLCFGTSSFLLPMTNRIRHPWRVGGSLKIKGASARDTMAPF
jgi:hypothetical protein